MKKKVRKNVVSFVIAITVLVFSFQPIVAAVFGNDLLDPIPGAERSNIECYVIDGAAAFLKAQSHAMNLFYEYEISSSQNFNYSASLEFTKLAIDYLKIAKIKYEFVASSLLNAQATFEKYSLLKEYDYSFFSVDNGFLEPTITQVKGYLSKGDVSGFYKKIISNITSLINNLEDAKKSIEANSRPRVELLWSLIQEFSSTTLFGNYGTTLAKSAFFSILEGVNETN